MPHAETRRSRRENRASGQTRDRLPQGSSEGGAGRESLRINRGLTRRRGDRGGRRKCKSSTDCRFSQMVETKRWRLKNLRHRRHLRIRKRPPHLPNLVLFFSVALCLRVSFYSGSRQRGADSTLRLARAIGDRRFWPEISADHRRRQKHPRGVRTRRPHALHPKCGCRVSCCGGTTNGIAP